MNLKKSLNYNQISMVPRVISELEHRRDANMSQPFMDGTLSVPIMSSPMPDVTGNLLARKITDIGCSAIIHRFQTEKQQVSEFLSTDGQKVGCAVGITNDLGRIDDLYNVGCRLFLIDVANGANTNILKTLRHLQSLGVWTIVGNVASKEGFYFLASEGVNYIRVGIAGGMACTTKNECGIYQGMASCISEIVEAKYKMNYSISSTVKIIADGGIRQPSDFCKALALGADIVMFGSVLASCDESPARTVRLDGKLHKIFRGAASYSTKQDMGAELKNIEGKEMLLEYSGKVGETIKRYTDGLQSSMSYMNAKNLSEYRKNASFMEVS